MASIGITYFVGKNLSPHQISEQAILKIIKSPKTHNFSKSIDISFCDEIGQVSAEIFSCINIILRRVRNNNIFLGGLVIIGTIDHTQIQPIEGRQFLTSSHIILCFRMVELKHSVRANSEHSWQHIQVIAQFSNNILFSNTHLKHEFINLVSQHCTFVSDWNSNLITSSTIRLYARKKRAKKVIK